MLTPELQNYVSQSKAAGQSDEQIKSALQQQGWGADDINAALGLPVQSSVASTSPHTLRNVIIALVVLLLLVGLSWGGIALFTFYKIKNSGFPNSDNSSGQTTIPITQGSCAQQAGAFNPGAPDDFPSDMPVYPGAKVSGWMSGNSIAADPKSADVGEVVYYCSDDSVNAIYTYYKNSKSNWNIRTLGQFGDSDNANITLLANNTVATAYYQGATIFIIKTAGEAHTQIAYGLSRQKVGN